MSSEMREFAGKADALAKRWRDDAKGFRERDMISAADDADFYAEELEAILPSAEADNGLYSPLTGAQEASMRGYCITQLQAVEGEYPDTGKFIREWLTHVENERNRLLAALLARTEAGADGDGFLGFVHECVWEDGTSRTIYEKQPSLLRERPGLISQRVVRAYTHPQDASGDAEWREFTRDDLPPATHQTFIAPRGLVWCWVGHEVIDIVNKHAAAMQAKEAK